MRGVSPPVRSPLDSSRWLSALALVSLVLLSGCSAFSRAVREGDGAVKERHWAEAEAAYLRALAADPEASEIKVKLRTVRKEWGAEVYLEAGAAHASGDLPSATKLLVRVLELDPDHENAHALLAQTLEARVGVALGLLKEEKLQDARAELDAVLAVAPDHVNARKGVDAVQVAWAKRFFSSAETLEKAGKLGNALLAYVRADQERVGATAARERAEAVRQRLRDEVAFLVVATPVEDNAQAPDVAQRLGAGRLAAALPTQLPLKVVTEAPPGRVGVKLDLALERVLPLKSVEESQRSQRYLAGNRSVPNPKRGQYESKLLEAERTLEGVERKQAAVLREYLRAQVELGTLRDAAERCREREKRECRTALQECGEEAREAKKPGSFPGECNPERCSGQCTQDEGLLSLKFKAARVLEVAVQVALDKAESQRVEVQRNRDAVFREPITVEEPMYSDFVYDVQLHRLTVTATVTAVMRDLLSPQQVAAPNTQDYAVLHEDLAHKGYDRYGVLADPVQLRNELELRVDAGDKAVADLAKRVKERFDVYRGKRVEDARRGMVRPGAEDVVETAVRALLLTADAPPQDILQPVARARGLTKPEALLGVGQ
ncbi:MULTISPECIES: outer membrane exchange accessory lipoprotein TraC [Corallococcus]|uniref:outer membrane exchange accessory lipoprotein TraC n=1 Tax=Corallococcus TaxID=83461 RepID=UPI00117F732D|nr:MULTISPECIES: outer membrane exchange accessory lipoprotein TraC [Corallococcus]NBD13723.1 TetR family transcriptional regulator [Corallococcus silvisoli]TSC22816.1 TetR family transcriptional regulator [Corallococcus sp. Z5C101001]